MEEEKFDEFLIHGTIGALSILIIMICLCFCFRRCCTRSLVVDRRDMEQLDREAYDDLKKEYMERRR